MSTTQRVNKEPQSLPENSKNIRVDRKGDQWICYRKYLNSCVDVSFHDTEQEAEVEARRRIFGKEMANGNAHQSD